MFLSKNNQSLRSMELKLKRYMFMNRNQKILKSNKSQKKSD